MGNWWELYANVVTLTAYMASEGRSPHEVARAVEKPWNYEAEFLAALAEIEGDPA